MATGWIYILGDRDGSLMKIGWTNDGRTVSTRAREVTKEWKGQREFVVLAGVRGNPKDEAAMRRPFPVRTDFGSDKEYHSPTDELTGYANWLRSQWYVSPDGLAETEEFPVVQSDFWLPGDGRLRAREDDDPSKLVQDYAFRDDHLAATAWDWMLNPKASIQDYFTPSELVDAAREAMGGIDLDAASHWIANRTHKIPDYFDINRSAFDNPWHGRVWLNPPYGDNAPWFREIERYAKCGDVTQLCMLSPVWAFTTHLARPVMDLSSAFLLLSPTPKFWGNSQGRTGTNNPHGILYIGPRRDEFLRAFADHGIPLSFPWDAIDDTRKVAS